MTAARDTFTDLRGHTDQIDDGEPLVCLDGDGRPVHDHFKVVGGNAMIGIMHGNGALDTTSGPPRPLYFYLERV
jgi:Domain of unknown function (DUF4334)